ncbi:MAG: 4Fe-4S binding protein [Anaerolineales bacterium]
MKRKAGFGVPVGEGSRRREAGKEMAMAGERKHSRSGKPQSGTRAFVSEARRTPGFSFFDLLHGYVYARWPYLYIGVGKGDHPLTRVFKWLVAPFSFAGGLFGKRIPEAKRHGIGSGTVADTYHGKVVPLEQAKQLIEVNEEITLHDLEHVLPYPKARDIILRNPDHLVALECPCRSSKPDGCRPLDVCLVVGEPFAGMVMQHHASRARWIDRGEAVEILQAEHERGHVHHAFFKDAMLGRYYAICNCCSCCCGAMQLTRDGVPMLASSGYVSRVDASLCTACGDCEQSCPFGALGLVEETVCVDGEACMGCGVCVSVCQKQALALVRDPEKSEPLVIQELIRQAQ